MKGKPSSKGLVADGRILFYPGRILFSDSATAILVENKVLTVILAIDEGFVWTAQIESQERIILPG